MIARGLPNIYVISLPSAELRRHYMRAQLDSPFVANWRFVDAIPKAEIDEAWIAERERGRRYASGKLTVSEHACLASHLKALRTLLDNGDEMAIILEDDASLAQYFPEIVGALAGRVEPNRPGVVVLNWTPLYYLLSRRRVYKRTYLYTSYAGHGAQGYLVTRESAKQLLKIHDEILINPDDWSYFINNCDLHVQCLVPYVVSHGLLGRNSQLLHRHEPSVRPRWRGRLKKWFGSKWREKYVRRSLRFVREQPHVF